MTRYRLVDTYIRLNNRWVLFAHGYGARSRSEYKLAGYEVRIIPCRQRAWTGRSAKYILDCLHEGFTGGYMGFERRALERGMYDSDAFWRLETLRDVPEEEGRKIRDGLAKAYLQIQMARYTKSKAKWRN